MIKRILVWCLGVLIIAACAKEVLKPLGKRLGEVTVESDAGEIPVLINATGIWRAASMEDWISVDDAWHRDQYSVVLHYGSNQSVEGMHRSDRMGKVLIITADGAECDTLVIHQKGLQL